MASVRRDLCQDTDPRALSQQSSGNRDPRAIHLNGLARTSVCRRRRPTPHSHQPVQRLEERNRLHLLHAGCVGVTAARGGSPLGVVTMSMHKLTAGSGYDYLTRQVAALDATAKGHVGLASYYTERGETPGVWVGSGLAGHRWSGRRRCGDRGADAGSVRLRACIRWPTQRRNSSAPLISTDADIQAATRLGLPFKVFDTEPQPGSGSRSRAGSPRSTSRPGCRRTGQSRRPSGPGSGPRWRGSCSAAEHGRPPAMPGSWPGRSRSIPGRGPAVAGFDLTFSPVKSVSTLWAFADPQVAAQIERAHQAAVADALRFLEQHALFTRRAAGGPAGERARADGGGVHPSRQPRRRSGSAHPCGGGEQGPNPRRPVAVDRRPGAVQSRPWPPRRPTTPPWKIISATGWVCGSRTGPTPTRETSGAGDRRCRPGAEPALVDPAGLDQ